jgi:hypothetical protein
VQQLAGPLLGSTLTAGIARLEPGAPTPAMPRLRATRLAACPGVQEDGEQERGGYQAEGQ